MSAKREKIEHLILLEQSGELTPSQEKELAQTLAQDSSMQDYREGVIELTSTVSRQVPERDVSDFAMHRIMKEARRSSMESRAKPTIAHPPLLWWKPALAIAATLLLFAAVAPVLLNRGGDSQSATLNSRAQDSATDEYLTWDGVDSEILAVNSLLETAQSEWANATDWNGEQSDELEEMGEELLRLEGISI